MPAHTLQKLVELLQKARKKRDNLWIKLKRIVHSMEGLDEDIKRWEKARQAKEFDQALNIKRGEVK